MRKNIFIMTIVLLVLCSIVNAFSVGENISSQSVDLFHTNCLYIEWNVTPLASLIFDTNTTLINISSSGIITGCYDNSSLGNYSIEVNVSKVAPAQTENNTFNLEILETPHAFDTTFFNVFDIGLNNVSVFFLYDNMVHYDLIVNNITYSLNENETPVYSDTIYISPLESDTIYSVNLIAHHHSQDIYSSEVIYFKTLSYDDINININEERNQYMLYAIILFVLFLLYIIAEIFRHIEIGFISGVGFVVLSFVFRTIELWFFLIILAFGIYILVRFSLSALGKN